MVDAATKMKFSYIPVSVKPKKPIYIFDDDDLSCYLEWNQTEFNVMHVELEKDDEQNHGCEQNRVGETGEVGEIGNVGEVGASNAEELISCARTRIGDGIMTLYAGETFEHNELVRNDDNVASEEQEDVIVNDDMLQVTKVHLEWEDGVNLTIGQEFGSKKAVQDLVEKCAHKNCFEFVIVKSDPKLYVVKCSESKKGCKWSLRVAKLQNSDCFSVRTYNKIHTCYRSTTSTSRNKRKGSQRLVASVLREEYPCKLKTPVPKDLIPLIQTRVGVKVSYSTAWRGKKQAASEVRGSLEESYKMLYSYMHMLEVVNPETVSCVELDEKNNFKYLFFALGACVEGFKAMRQVIIVDGTHLKTAQGGVLIVATAQDPNHHHYPIAFGVVDGENYLSWSWFFNKLKSRVPDAPELVFVSDRNQSLIKSVAEVYSLSQHGYCIYHLAQNVKAACSNVNKDTVGRKFIECARSYTEGTFKTLYHDFRIRYPAAAVYLDSHVEEKKWARCYFPGARYNIDTNNCVESINGVFKDARQYSLLPMIDAIVGKLAEWFNEHRKTSASVPPSQIMVPLLEKILHQRCEEAKLLPVYELNSFLLEYNVIGADGSGYLMLSAKHLRVLIMSVNYMIYAPNIIM
ncbi:PREDICTED: uncharacterized protein LOC104728599 [Camelina sativa]|uniref:Uncharacterized protein LOC104728599 n=1 Tax=Camelina sativa TaxID=90675 RepID=A0ABM0UT17_CAMSA|nr:PREDICTED: uncharacterized protein LOC104728599 [Camelina sativa]